MYLLPSQSVNDLRYYDGNGSTILVTPGPATLVDSLSNSPSVIVWTPPV